MQPSRMKFSIKLRRVWSSAVERSAPNLMSISRSNLGRRRQNSKTSGIVHSIGVTAVAPDKIFSVVISTRARLKASTSTVFCSLSQSTHSYDFRAFRYTGSSCGLIPQRRACAITLGCDNRSLRSPDSLISKLPHLPANRRFSSW